MRGHVLQPLNRCKKRWAFPAAQTAAHLPVDIGRLQLEEEPVQDAGEPLPVLQVPGPRFGPGEVLGSVVRFRLQQLLQISMVNTARNNDKRSDFDEQ